LAAFKPHNCKIIDFKSLLFASTNSTSFKLPRKLCIRRPLRGPLRHCSTSSSILWSPITIMEHQPSSAESERENSLFLKLVYWHKLFESDTPPRLGIDVEKRIPYATMCAFFPGLALGYVHGSKKAGLLFRAENAHRFPTTSTGWFQYHKTKNYISIVGGVKDGLKMGAKLGVGALAFSLFEETVDYARHEERDFLSTVTAGLSFSGIYSLLGKTSVGFFRV